LPPGKGSVFGRIAFEDGEPVRGVCVQLSGSPSTPCMTDDEGRFRIDGEWVATRDLAITEGDALYLRIAKAELRADEAIRLDVVLKRGTLLEGVVAKAGSPVGGAVVQLERPGAAGARTIQGSFGRAVTDAAGRFAFPFLPDGLYTIFASRDGIEPAYAEVAVAPGLPPQVLAVRDARPLQFRFVPMPESWRGKKLLFGIGSMEGKPINLLHNRAPDERGEITVDAPPPGRWFVRQLPGGHRAFEVTEASVPEIVIDLHGARVFGKVSTQCRISVGGEEARTDADGSYEIALVPAGEAEVRLRIANVTIERPRLLVPGSGEVRLDVELRGVNVRGCLVAEGDYQRWVSLWRTGKGPFGTVETGADGFFAIPFVEPGEYEIWGTTTEQQGTHQPIVVGREDLDLGDIAVDLGPEVPLIVTAPAGVRLAGRHSVWAVRGSEHRLVYLSLDEAGHGVIRLPAGKWRVTLGLGGLQQAEVEIEVPLRESVRIDLER
ncbi:MAG: carboxypeptidase-like regulatory domain-containing protein, partial [Actinobacteria bacterium]|nr:carboxypeptidase-like regulatory domain-containing protein [Actinomycetota bacterium]